MEKRLASAADGASLVLLLPQAHPTSVLAHTDVKPRLHAPTSSLRASFPQKHLPVPTVNCSIRRKSRREGGLQPYSYLVTTQLFKGTPPSFYGFLNTGLYCQEPKGLKTSMVGIQTAVCKRSYEPIIIIYKVGNSTGNGKLGRFYKLHPEFRCRTFHRHSIPAP